MSRLTVRLPETLHHQLKTQAQQEGVSLNQYIVYALTCQTSQKLLIQGVSEEEIVQQREAFISLRKQLGNAMDAEVKHVVSEREVVEPEVDLSPQAVAALRKSFS